MNSSSRFFRYAWLPVLVCACGFLISINQIRRHRVEYVSGLPGRAEAVDILDPQSPTGYAHAQRELIVPERNEDTFHWLLQTQQMLSTGDWRIRQIDYDNAPPGREVNAASPYRWWLGILAWSDHLLTGQSLGLAVERIALWADPILQISLLVLGTLFIVWQFGSFASILFSFGMAAIFPLASEFLPGEPDDRGFTQAFAVAGILVLLAGVQKLFLTARKESTLRQVQFWFAGAGAISGFGLWIGVSTAIPTLAGIFFGALCMAFALRKTTRTAADRVVVTPPWRTWAIAGAATVCLGYLAEYFPSHLRGMHLETVHPLYGLAWLGAGELLARSVAWIEGKKPSFKAVDIMIIILAVGALVPVPVIMKINDSRGFLGVDLLALRLSKLPGSPIAGSFWIWLLRDGFDVKVWTVLLPLALLGLAGWVLLRRKTHLLNRALIALAIGPVLFAIGYASQELIWWNVLDGTLLALLVAGAVNPPSLGFSRIDWTWAALTVLAIAPGCYQLWPKSEARAGQTLTSPEAELLIERDLAHWLAKRSGDDRAIVYAPPHGTATLSFYGGLRGLGTFSVDNRVGLGATITLASVTTMEEAQVLVQKREIRYFVIPSWDHFFEEYGHIYLAKSLSDWQPFFIPELRRWHLPGWLRPVPYQMPNIGGFEGQSVLIFEVVDEQNPSVAASRLAEYMVEMGDVDQAIRAGDALRKYPGDIGALAARAQVENARNNPAGFAQVVQSLLPRLSSGADRYLPWDRRISLAIVLARGGHTDLAQAQLRRCLTDINDQRIRSLSTGSLYSFLVMSHAFNLPIADPKLHATALDLLSPDLRGRL